MESTAREFMGENPKNLKVRRWGVLRAEWRSTCEGKKRTGEVEVSYNTTERTRIESIGSVVRNTDHITEYLIGAGREVSRRRFKRCGKGTP